jgi:hypothetical protein
MIAIPIAVQSQCEALQTRAASLLVLASERVDALAQHLDAWSAKRERWELLRSAPDATFGTLIEDNSELETGEIRARLIAAHAERCVAAHRAAQVLVAALVDDAWTQCVRLQSELDALIRTHVAVPTLTLAACERLDGNPAIADRLADAERRVAAVRGLCCGVQDMQVMRDLNGDASFDTLVAAVARLDELRRARRLQG